MLELSLPPYSQSQLGRNDQPRGLFHPPLTALGEDGIQVALEDGAGVLEVLFGVGFGGGDALKRLIQDADNPPLFGERGDRN